MATVFAKQFRAAGIYDTPALAVNKLKGKDVSLQGSLDAPQLNDPNFLMKTLVRASKLQNPLVDADWVVIDSDDFYGGGVGHDGQPLQPVSFAFRNDSLDDAYVKLGLRIITNAGATWGINATIPA